MGDDEKFSRALLHIAEAKNHVAAAAHELKGSPFVAREIVRKLLFRVALDWDSIEEQRRIIEKATREAAKAGA